MKEMSNEFKNIDNVKSKKNSYKFVVFLLYILVLILVVMVVVGFQNKDKSNALSDIREINAE